MGSFRRLWTVFIVLLPTIGFGWIGSCLIIRSQLRLCPPATFLSISTLNAPMWIGLMLAGLATTLLAIALLAQAEPRTRRLFEGKEGLGAPNWNRMAVQSTATIFAGMAIAAGAGVSNLCLAPQRITVREWPWQRPYEYSWGDVVEVTTRCWHSRDWATSFVLRMSDDRRLELQNSHMGWVDAYPKIADALRGVDFTFDSTGVVEDCGSAYAGLLRKRP